jgi:hypothetical protein
MAARKYIPDLRIGDSYIIKIRYKNGMNITGYRIDFTAKSAFSDRRSALHAFTIAGNDSEDDPLNGICILKISSATTKLLKAGTYVYDVRATSPALETITLLPPSSDYESNIEFIPQVTVF